jgi:Tfp pilus assembly protein PilP
MRRAHTIRTAISLVALLAWTAAGLPAQTNSTQAKQPAPSKSAAAKPAPAKAAPSQGQPPAAKQPSKAAPSKGPAQTAKQPSKAAPSASKPASQAAGQAKQPSKAAKTKAPAKAKAAQPAAVQRVARRDPFEALVSKNRGGSGIPENLPPGKAGLMVSTLRLDGLVRGPNGMIAVVSNPQQRTYFLREGDKLYDGRVERITLEAATFHETGKDAFGKPVERQVVKRLYSSPGESR